MRSQNGTVTPKISSATANWKNWILVTDVLSNPSLSLPSGNNSSRIFKLQTTGNCKIATSDYSSSGTATWSIASTTLSKPTTISGISYSNSFVCSGTQYLDNNSNMPISNLNLIFERQFGTVLNQRIINLKYE
jgi:hypothetical protein